MGQMEIDTTKVSGISSTFKGSVSGIGLESIDVAGAFEPFTSQGILTGYVSSLKSALSSISENCTNIAGILDNLATSQSNIDTAGTQGANTDYFGTSTRSGGSNYSGGTSGYHSTGTNNGQSTVGVNSSNASEQQQQLNGIMSSEYLESLLSILTSSSSAITSEERASYLKELLKLKLQGSKELQEVVESMDPSELQAYLKKIYNGELAINDATVSVTYDILEQIAKERNIELKELITEENMDIVREKVEQLSQEYITLFNSNDLRTELQNIYDGNNIDGKSDELVKSVRTAIDLIAVNNETTGDNLLLEDSQVETLKTEIGKISESLGQLRMMSTKSNSEFLESLSNIFKEDTSVVATA